MGAYPYLSDLILALTGIDIPLKIATFGFCLACALLLAIWVLGREIQRMQAVGYIPEVKAPDKKKTNAPAEQTTPVKKGNKKKGTQPKAATNTPLRVVPPKEIATNIGVISGLVGIIGARLFHILEYPDRFMADPIGMLFARSGLTVLGGLLLGSIAALYYVRRVGIKPLTALDAAGPAMLVGYAIGRLGCQLSGDGDWGITANMSLKPDWLPTVLWAQTYVGNVIGAEIPAPGVYPTPIYETVACLLLFAILWRLRHFNFRPGWLFSWYLVFSGFERLLIEQIRVNATYDWGFIEPTQAEILSVLMIVGGIWGLYKTWKPYTPPLSS